MESKLLKLKNRLQELRSVLVAYSGGVDSALLLAVAHKVLGDKAIAVTAVSELMTEKEVEEAKFFTANQQIRHMILPVSDLTDPEFTNNTPNRCYYCKKRRFIMLKDLAQQKGIDWVIEGSNLDDLSDYRPGARAIKELNILSPLQEAGFTKKDVRNLAQELGLSVWNKPSQPCLATRIAYGTTITKEALNRVKKAEEYLTSLLGTHTLRVRDHNTIARLEINHEDFSLIALPANAKAISNKLKSLGFSYVTLDLQGYRQGSMNEILQPGELKHK